MVAEDFRTQQAGMYIYYTYELLQYTYARTFKYVTLS